MDFIEEKEQEEKEQEEKEQEEKRGKEDEEMKEVEEDFKEKRNDPSPPTQGEEVSEPKQQTIVGSVKQNHNELDQPEIVSESMESESNITMDYDRDRDGDCSPIFHDDTFNEVVTKDYYNDDTKKIDANGMDTIVDIKSTLNTFLADDPELQTYHNSLQDYQTSEEEKVEEEGREEQQFDETLLKEA